jgi:hypothetical protein
MPTGNVGGDVLVGWMIDPAGLAAGAAQAIRWLEQLAGAGRAAAASLNTVGAGSVPGIESMNAALADAQARIAALEASTATLSGTTVTLGATMTTASVSGEELAASTGAAGTAAVSAGNAFSYMEKRIQWMGALGAGLAIFETFKLSGDFQRLQAGMSTLVGSDAAAQSFLTSLRQFEPHTPFTLPEEVGWSRQLMAAKVSIDQIIPSIKAEGDAASALGATAEDIGKFNRMLMELSAGVPAGRVLQYMARDIPGLNPYDILSKSFHEGIEKIKSDIKDGTISSTDVRDALLAGMEKQFAGAMDKMMNTLPGQFSNLLTKAWNAAIALGTPMIPALEGLFKGVGSGLDSFSHYGEAIAKTLTDVVNDVAPVIDGLKEILGFFLKIGGWLIQNPVTRTILEWAMTFKLLTSMISPLMSGFAGMINIMGNMARGDSGLAQMAMGWDRVKLAMAGVTEEAGVLKATMVTLGESTYTTAEGTVVLTTAEEMASARMTALTEATWLQTAGQSALNLVTGSWPILVLMAAVGVYELVADAMKKAHEAAAGLTQAENDLTIVNSQISLRTKEADTLQKLSDNYNELIDKQKKGIDVADRLGVVTNQINSLFSVTATQLGIETTAWDKTNESMRVRLKLLKDMADLQNQQTLDKDRVTAAKDLIELQSKIEGQHKAEIAAMIAAYALGAIHGDTTAGDALRKKLYQDEHTDLMAALKGGYTGSDAEMINALGKQLQDERDIVVLDQQMKDAKPLDNSTPGASYNASDDASRVDMVNKLAEATQKLALEEEHLTHVHGDKDTNTQQRIIADDKLQVSQQTEALDLYTSMQQATAKLDEQNDKDRIDAIKTQYDIDKSNLDAKYASLKNIADFKAKDAATDLAYADAQAKAHEKQVKDTEAAIKRLAEIKKHDDEEYMKLLTKQVTADDYGWLGNQGLGIAESLYTGKSKQLNIELGIATDPAAKSRINEQLAELLVDTKSEMAKTAIKMKYEPLIIAAQEKGDTATAKYYTDTITFFERKIEYEKQSALLELQGAEKTEEAKIAQQKITDELQKQIGLATQKAALSDKDIALNGKMGDMRRQAELQAALTGNQDVMRAVDIAQVQADLQKSKWEKELEYATADAAKKVELEAAWRADVEAANEKFRDIGAKGLIADLQKSKSLIDSLFGLNELTHIGNFEAGAKFGMAFHATPSAALANISTAGIVPNVRAVPLANNLAQNAQAHLSATLGIQVGIDDNLNLTAAVTKIVKKGVGEILSMVEYQKGTLTRGYQPG